MTRNSLHKSYTINSSVQQHAHDLLSELRTACYRVVYAQNHFFITYLQHVIDDCYDIAIAVLDADGVAQPLELLPDPCILKFMELRTACQNYPEGIPVQDPEHLNLYMSMQYGTETDSGIS